ncbi:disease resistance-like protein CSA1 [Ziziphus jujuba]|uniref:Disease resistance-like protein CSA1 n=1 Tax=Ziziphus jujuba TaxID=326968 RepID=A0ABM3IHL9_ZIZJJ|nr:disease resistance-like protein CSA1 [Ziziphus jujuba]
MKKLRLLIIRNLALEMRDGHSLNIEYLSKELRFLQWHKFPAEYLPSDFQRGGLVVLKLWWSKSLRNNPIKPLNSLKTIDISHSTNLRKFEDFGVVPNLERLILEGCVNLVEIDQSITLLKRLTILNLKCCIGLQNLPTSMGSLKSLKVLNLEGCVSLTNLPEDLGLLNSLEKLNLGGISIEGRYLPSWSGGRQCNNLMNTIVGKGFSSSAGFFSLKRLVLSSCGLGNEAFPENFGCLVSLRHLNLSNNDFSRLPVSFNKLSKLHTMNLGYCRNLELLGPELPPDLRWIGLSCSVSLDGFLDALMNDQCNMACSVICEGCLKLATRQSSERTTFTLLKRYLQKRPRYVFNFVLPGNEIPSWFTRKSFKPSITLQLDPNWFNSKWMGFTVCSCFRTPSPSFGYAVKIEELNCGLGRRCTYEKKVVSAVDFPMDHLWIMYWPRRLITSDILPNIPVDQEWGNNCSRLTFSFKTYDLDGKTHTDKYIRSCGVHLVYKQDIEDMNPVFSDGIEYPFEG